MYNNNEFSKNQWDFKKNNEIIKVNNLIHCKAANYFEASFKKKLNIMLS